MYAIVKTGGKQYKVAVGDIIEVEKLETLPGDSVELDVVFIADGSTVTTEADKLVKACVVATVVEQFKGEKQIIFKFKKRKGYKRLKGHRQNLTKLKIDSIELDGKKAKPAKKAVDKKPAEKAPAKKVSTEDKPKVKKTAAADKPEAKAADKPKAKAADKPKTEAADKPKAKAATKSDDAEKPKAKAPRAKAKADDAAADTKEKQSQDKAVEDETKE
jgi:large subunit ribosomal protein L21